MATTPYEEKLGAFLEWCKLYPDSFTFNGKPFVCSSYPQKRSTKQKPNNFMEQIPQTKFQMLKVTLGNMRGFDGSGLKYLSKINSNGRTFTLREIDSDDASEPTVILTAELTQ